MNQSEIPCKRYKLNLNPKLAVFCLLFYVLTAGFFQFANWLVLNVYVHFCIDLGFVKEDKWFGIILEF